eukprot:5497067-Amphidinium_carterae.2
MTAICKCIFQEQTNPGMSTLDFPGMGQVRQAPKFQGEGFRTPGPGMKTLGGWVFFGVVARLSLQQWLHWSWGSTGMDLQHALIPGVKPEKHTTQQHKRRYLLRSPGTSTNPFATDSNWNYSYCSVPCTRRVPLDAISKSTTELMCQHQHRTLIPQLST